MWEPKATLSVLPPVLRAAHRGGCRLGLHRFSFSRGSRGTSISSLLWDLTGASLAQLRTPPRAAKEILKPCLCVHITPLRATGPQSSWRRATPLQGTYLPP